MIMLGFLAVSGLLLGSAAVAGNIGACVNVDSLVLVLAAMCIAMPVFSRGAWKKLGIGLHTIVRFSKTTPDRETAKIFAGLAISLPAFGLLSMLQGIYSGLMAGGRIPPETIIWYASYTFFYSLLISLFLFFPVVLVHRATQES